METSQETVSSSDTKIARRTVLANFERLALPTSARGLSQWSREELLDVAVRYNCPPAAYEVLEAKATNQVRWHVTKNFHLIRNASIAAFRDGGNALPLSSMQALLSWKDLTSTPVYQESAQGASVHERPDTDSLDAGTSASSELASSPEIQQMLASIKLLSDELKVLKEERSIAPDEDDDSSAGGRRLNLLPSTLQALPEDPVRAELTKTSLASILRGYPLPNGYILKAGELSVNEKAKLAPLVAEEITKLGKIINRYSDVARPLISLLNVLEEDAASGATLVKADMVRTVVLHTLELLFHHQSKLENERHLVHFRDEKLLQAAFQKPVKKAFFSESEMDKLKKLADEQKQLRKLRENVAQKTIKKARQHPARPQQPAPRGNHPAPQSRGSASDKGMHRHAKKPSAGKPQRKFSDKSGDARGKTASAQQE